MQLKEFLSYPEIYIQCHDNPDADALASGFGLYTYFASKNIPVHLIYCGSFQIQKSSLVLMIERLHIPITYMDASLIHLSDELLITVDCQYGAGNVTPIDALHIGIIDHHQVENRSIPDSVIRSDYGSCSTVVWQLLCEENINPNDDPFLATALYYGLYSDTQQFSEIHNPADKDMRDNLRFRNSIFSLLKNSNISASDFELAGLAILRAVHNKAKRYSLIKADPCDPNILGLISDMCIQVDGTDLCIVYNELDDIIKFSVRSCIRETKACDLAAYLSCGIGSGGGHTDKAGGFLNRKRYLRAHPHTDTQDFFADRLDTYLESFDILDARTYTPVLSDMKPYRTRRLPTGYFVPASVLPVHTPVTIRTMDGDFDLIISEHTYLLIDQLGKVHIKTKADFLADYEPTDAPYAPAGVYSPTIRNRITGTRTVLAPYLQTCVPIHCQKVRVLPLTKPCKVFPLWNEETYLQGNIGDYLVVSTTTPQELFVVPKELFEQNYEPEE